MRIISNLACSASFRFIFLLWRSMQITWVLGAMSSRQLVCRDLRLEAALKKES